MIARVRSVSAWQRGLLLVAFACVLLLRAAVPAGWMPAHDASGGYLELCDAYGASGAMAGMAMSAPASHRHAPKSTRSDCPFAALGLAVDMPTPVLDPLPYLAFGDTTRHLAGRPQRGHVAIAAPPPPKTGPPALSFA